MRSTDIPLLRVYQLNASTFGGAGRAAYRIHKSICKSCPTIDCRMLVLSSDATDESIETYQLHWSRKATAFLLSRIEALKLSRHHTSNPNFHSTGYPGLGIPGFLGKRPHDLIHIHGVGECFLSIEDLQRINKPIVWTMHDEWGYLGADHYHHLIGDSASSLINRRDVIGYSRSNRPYGESGYDLNRKTWYRKWKAWKMPINIVCPSVWLADSASHSLLMRDWPITVIPNPIDLQYWSSIDMGLARRLLDLPQSETLVLFGVDHGSSHPRKGADLLLDAFRIIHQECSSDVRVPRLVVFGQRLSLPPDNSDVPYIYIGRFRDDMSLRTLYSAVNAVVIPSRQDNFPNIGIEAHACGKPVIAFNIGGLPDIIHDGVTGSLAQPFDPHSLAYSLQWVTSSFDHAHRLGSQARVRAEELWSETVVANQYKLLYETIYERRLAGASFVES